jgi:chloramphenicol-sensitive protein RarD
MHHGCCRHPHAQTRKSLLNSGIALSLGAYLIWGLLPLYLHRLAGVSAPEVLTHRVVWSLVTVSAIIVVTRGVGALQTQLRQARVWFLFSMSALMISCNWLLYIWSIDSGHIVDASLGYFINPLVNVLLGALFFRERLHRLHWLSLAIAAAGVAYLTWQTGHPPWIGLALAATFSSYGLIRKTAPLGAIHGFWLETAVMAPFALAYAVWLNHDGQLAMAHADLSTTLLLLGAGPVTALPLLLFAAGARRMPFSLLGVLQYVSPSLQWLIGVAVYREPFDVHKGIGFAAIWLAVAVYLGQTVVANRRGAIAS